MNKVDKIEKSGVEGRSTESTIDRVAAGIGSRLASLRGFTRDKVRLGNAGRMVFAGIAMTGVGVLLEGCPNPAPPGVGVYGTETAGQDTMNLADSSDVVTGDAIGRTGDAGRRGGDSGNRTGDSGIVPDTIGADGGDDGDGGIDGGDGGDGGKPKDDDAISDDAAKDGGNGDLVNSDGNGDIDDAQDAGGDAFADIDDTVGNIGFDADGSGDSGGDADVVDDANDAFDLGDGGDGGKPKDDDAISDDSSKDGGSGDGGNGDGNGDIDDAQDAGGDAFADIDDTVGNIGFDADGNGEDAGDAGNGDGGDDANDAFDLGDASGEVAVGLDVDNDADSLTDDILGDTNIPLPDASGLDSVDSAPDGATDDTVGDTGSLDIPVVPDVPVELPNPPTPTCPDGSFEGQITVVPSDGPNGFGICKDGVAICAKQSNGALTSVIIYNPVNKATETCDNKDNNCNNLTDEGFSVTTYSGPIGTELVGECRGEEVDCVDGVMKKVKDQILPTFDTCNGKDDDCNGITDDDGKGGPIVTPFYNFDPATLGISVCHEGKTTCIDGKPIITTPEQGPAIQEFYGNGKDDDCNKKTDLQQSGGSCDENGDGYVDIEKWDPDFRDAMLIYLGKGLNGKITQVEADAVTNISLPNKGLSKLSGLECFQNATDLNFSQNDLSGQGIWSVISMIKLVNASFDLNPNLADLTPFIDNPGFGAGAKLSVKKTAAAGTQVNVLKAKGVNVISDYGN